MADAHGAGEGTSQDELSSTALIGGFIVVGLLLIAAVAVGRHMAEERSLPPTGDTMKPAPVLPEAPAPGSLETNAIGMELAYIPAGAFQSRGTTWVTIPHAFRMGTTEVTQAQWQAVMDDNPSTFKGDSLPVHNITWHDAATFCARLSEMDGRTYRLPTQMEWEYAGRATSTEGWATPGRLVEGAWYMSNSKAQPQPVGVKNPNKWNLYDIHGNVWEWLAAPVDSDGDTDTRHYIGGSHNNSARIVYSYSAGTGAADDALTQPGRTATIGLRVLCELPEDQAPASP